MSNVIRANALDVSRTAASLRGRRVWRIAWTMFTILLIQGLVCGAALLPVVLIGALSFVPKQTRLEAAAVYAGIPAECIG